jgi:cell division protein FtsL
LALVVCALVLSLAYPMKQYLAQRSQIAQLATQNAQKQAQVDVLERRKAQLKDPAYIKMLARERLQYVVPGESQYVVVKQGESGGGTGGSDKSNSAARSPWYSQLWGSVQKADRAP